MSKLNVNLSARFSRDNLETLKTDKMAACSAAKLAPEALMSVAEAGGSALASEFLEPQGEPFWNCGLHLDGFVWPSLIFPSVSLESWAEPQLEAFLLESFSFARIHSEILPFLPQMPPPPPSQPLPRPPPSSFQGSNRPDSLIKSHMTATLQHLKLAHLALEVSSCRSIMASFVFSSLLQ